MKKGQDGIWRSGEEGQDGGWRSQSSAWLSGWRIWQREYRDRFIRNELHYWTVKAYSENNPVQAGLVAHPEQWPWSCAAADWNAYNPW